MKRTPLKRYAGLERKPMKRSGITRRPRRGDEPEVRNLWAASQPQRCAVCWAPFITDRIVAHRHHILGGAKRIDDPRNLLLLCFQWGAYACRCHDIYHGERVPSAFGYWPALSLGMIIGAKRESDHDNYDPEWLQYVLGRKRLPEIEPLPNEFLLERERWSRLTKIA